jgi:hypothetical protein
MSAMRTSIAAAALALVGACGLDTPDDPTWVEDVRPILMANCVRCHGAPSLSEAPLTKRLDVFGITYRPGSDDEVAGAADLAFTHQFKKNVKNDYMPPRFPLTSRQKSILIDWENASDLDADRPGPPRTRRDDNVPPELIVYDLVVDNVDGVSATYALYDEDPDDYVTGMVYAVPHTPDPQIARDPGYRPLGTFGVQYLEPGQGTIRVDPTLRPFRDPVEISLYDIFAEVDDGIDAVTYELGTIDRAREVTP